MLRQNYDYTDYTTNRTMLMEYVKRLVERVVSVDLSINERS